MGQSDPESIDALDPLDELTQEFADRCRRGEPPLIDEFVARRPDLEGPIRQLFPTVAFLERGRLAPTRTDAGLTPGRSPRVVESPPRRIGENRILRELGRGGMGIVYEAEQESLSRRVAVKVLPGHAATDDKSRRRFLREAKAVARLGHPNIVPNHSVGEDGGIPYYVMTLIEGTSLDRLLAEEISDDPAQHPRWVASLGRQAAEALAYAHRQGILHRDVKPSNLILDHRGTLWLADFGLAKLADDFSLSDSGDLPGTLRYLAPECLRVEGDERSDLYSLGLTLYEMLAGRPAFPETNRARLLRQIQHDTPTPPSQLNPAIPRDLETILLKAMSREPESRYASASDLSADLERFLQGKTIHARPASMGERLARTIRRDPLVATLAATIFVLTMVSAYFVTLYLIAPPRSRRPDLPPPPPGRPGFPSPRPRGPHAERNKAGNPMRPGR